jgi:DNA-binding CsgD family transcriptional regulator
MGPLNAVPADLAARLSARERETLAHLAQGCANKEIAAAMGVTHLTVKQYVKQIYRKAGVSNRLLLALWWRERLLPPNDSGPLQLGSAAQRVSESF